MAGLPFAGGEANNIDQFITFIDGVGPVPKGRYRPMMRQDTHITSLRICLFPQRPRYRFEVSNGIYFDNDGSFAIQVFRAQPPPSRSRRA